MILYYSGWRSPDNVTIPNIMLTYAELREQDKMHTQLKKFQKMMEQRTRLRPWDEKYSGCIKLGDGTGPANSTTLPKEEWIE